MSALNIFFNPWKKKFYIPWQQTGDKEENL